MKKPFFILLAISSLSLLANTLVLKMLESNQKDPEAILSLLKRDPDPSTQAFLARLEEFELTHLTDSERASRRRQGSSPKEILRLLNSELLGPYLKRASGELGRCKQGNCLSQSKEGWLLEATSGEKFCYPGTDCSYYKCMEDRYRCNDVGFNYFAELAHPTCSSYVDRIGKQKFSQDGVDWIYTVMVCLQKGLFEECTLKGSCQKETRAKTCEHIVEFTLEFHPGCYIESGIGVCNLPFKDQLSIWKTVAPFLTRRETVEAFKVVYQCFFK
jgi:hypothetical protein